MMIEHTFVTTRDAAATLAMASELLTQLGFKKVTSLPDAADFCRGKASPQRADRADELPQRVRLEYDRGRVSMAASIECVRKSKPVHRSMLLSLTEAVEGYLGRNLPIFKARAAWDAVARDIAAKTARRRRLHLLITLLVSLLLVALIAIIWATTWK
jgi:hypothetical protein